ncbi:MAG: Fic family protein [Candidatus Saccharicenans sp.]|nr:Fic family protein [Candidatus Saccharicenans sp.]
MNYQSFQNSPAGRLSKTIQGYYAFIPNPLPPVLNWNERLVNSLSEADRAVGKLAGLSRDLPNPHLLIIPFMHSEAVLSSRIEGTQATISDVYKYETGQLSLFKDDKDISDVKEVHNYVLALDCGLKRLKELPLSLRLLREIHKILLEGVRGGESRLGEFRQVQNWIGPEGCSLDEALYVPPSVDEMNEALASLEKYLNRKDNLPPLIRVGLVHYQFEAIHPFIDGNGRIGRLLIILLLCAWDILPQPLLYLSPYFESNRQAYYDLLLEVSERGAWEEWLNFFLTAVKIQADDAILRINEMMELKEDYRAKMQSKRGSPGLFKAIDFLFEKPVFSANQLAKELGTNFARAQRYISSLKQAGIIREITGMSRNRIYAAEEIIWAIGSPLKLKEN